MTETSHLILSKDITDTELDYISTWVSETRELRQISGLETDTLDVGILRSWFNNSIQSVIVKDGANVIGFGMLTTQEVKTKEGEAEICHLIVHPKYRRIYNGSSLVHRLMSFGKFIGLNKIIARVNKKNSAGLELFNYLGWNKFTLNPPNEDEKVQWFFKFF
jgi:ribosomal protein S18 acetylase RimI-like enzyme